MKFECYLRKLVMRVASGDVAGVPQHLKGRSFTRVAAWSRDELETLLDLADEVKAERARRPELRLLPGRTIGLIFHKPSTRTRAHAVYTDVWTSMGQDADRERRLRDLEGYRVDAELLA